jgi:DNA-binding MarR family transcriptional regulator
VADPAVAARKRGEPAAPAAAAFRAMRGRAAGARSGDLDALIHHRLRLGILSALAARESCTFNELKALLGATDGNLSVHARRLEEARYVVCTKTFADRRPRTEYRLAPAGRQALERYLDHMEALIRATRPTLSR